MTLERVMECTTIQSGRAIWLSVHVLCVLTLK